ncbi:MAG: type IV secretion system protein TraC [Proteobacteria bacterium]|nr:type IV secretion system protein TraC [Pseudomonadota bacterium]
MDILKIHKQLLKRFSLSELLPYYTYDDNNEVYTLSCGVGFVYECSQAWGGATTSDALKGLYYQQFPPGTSVQYTIYASPTVTHQMDAYAHLRENRTTKRGLIEAARRKRDYVVAGAKQSMLKGYDFRARNFRHVVSCIVPCETTPNGFEQGMKIASRIKPTVVQALSTAHLNPRDMYPDEFVTLISEMLNPAHNHDEVQHYDAKTIIREQVVYGDTEIFVEKDYLKIDGKYLRSFTVKQYPEKWDIADTVNYVGSLYDNVRQMPCPFIITLNTEYPDRVKAIDAVQKKAVATSYQLFGPLAKWLPDLAEKKQGQDSFLKSMKTGDSPVMGYMNILIYADSPEELESMSGRCLQLFRTLGFILQVDTYITLPMFLQSLPMGYLKDAQEDLRRKKTLKASDIAEIAPIASDWQGFGNPVLHLISRRGQVQFFDIFSNPAGGYSGIVVASTGAGKSFFVNELITSYLSVGAKIWVIDVGRSYEKLANFCGGEFMVFGEHSNVCLNPFTGVRNIDEEMPILKSIVAQMVSMNALDELSLAYIEEAIKDQYLIHGNDMTITNVATYLAAKDEPIAISLSKRLYSYTSQGAYAGYFDGPATMRAEADLVVMELEELKSKKDLQEVVLLSLIFQIQQAMMDREQYKLLIIDEAWDLLTGGNTANFMETAYRRFRKYKGACYSITQSVNDFYRIPAGVAIVENSDFMFLLRQRPESIKMLKESGRVSLTEGLYELLSSVHTEHGNFSEIFVYTPVGVTVGRLIVDRFTQLLYTSKADEYTAIKKYLEQGDTIDVAITKVLEDEIKEREK